MKRFTTCMFLILIMATGLASAEVVRWIPAAASNPGNAGTFWSTDIWITNLVLDSPIDVHIAFLSESLDGADPVEVTVEVPARTTILIEDVVGTVLSESRPGAMRLRSDFPFEAQSRTFNTAGGNGTFGQAIPGIADSDSDSWFLNSWILIGAANRPTEDGVRSNIGLYNRTRSETDVKITVISAETGEVVGQAGTEVSVGGFGWIQANVFELVGAPDAVIENASVHVFGRPSVSGYLSRIDNQSGDGAFFLPIASDYVSSIPADWEITVSLEMYSSASVDAIVYTGPEGWDVVVTEPESGWSTTVIIGSPAEFCFEVWGHDGGVAVEFELQRSEGNGQSGGSFFLGASGDSPSIRKCFNLW